MPDIARGGRATFEIDLDSQLVLYKSFDQKVMAESPAWSRCSTTCWPPGSLAGLVYAPQLARIDKPAGRRNIVETHAHPARGR